MLEKFNSLPREVKLLIGFCLGFILSPIIFAVWILATLVAVISLSFGLVSKKAISETVGIAEFLTQKKRR